MAEHKQKNRRCRHAKFSEYRLKKLVMCFAQNMTVKDAVAKTRLSEPTVRSHFMRIRERIFEHSPIRVNRRTPGPMPARAVFGRKHRGVPEKYAHLYETEFLSRVFASRNTRFVKKFSASKVADLKAVKKFAAYNKAAQKYNIIEVLPGIGEAGERQETREFDFADYDPKSTIVINELKLDPDEAFFRYIWALLLKYPL